MYLPIILASTSPRRTQLLHQAGVAHDILSVEIDESWQDDESATDYISRMVNQKANQAIAKLAGNQDCLVITADTIGVLDDGTVLTKPINQADAYRMWDCLSGATHQIWTAVCVSRMLAGVQQREQICVCTEVDFVPLTESMKQRYWATGEPLDKAGAYAIQGGAMAWVSQIRGSYTNVVGLPLAQTVALIDKMQTGTTQD